MQPSRLGPYTISARLGRGGMGAVYEAVDTTTGATVALKTLAAHLGDDPGLRKRFAAEIEALKSLRHPGIVRLIAFGEDDGQPYFAMELVRGRSLEQALREGRRFDWRETVDTALEITRALKAAHDHGVIHRDLKPGNLLFPDAAGPDARVKLADFGIARLFGDPAQTSAGTVVGTAEYMAPEQAAGRPVDPRADLYALGLVMYAMLTGRPPFQGGKVADVLVRQQTETPPLVSSRVPGVPTDLDALIARLLSKDPAGRPASALAVGRQLTVIAAADSPAAESAAAAPNTAIDLLAPTRGFSRVNPPDTAPVPVSVTDRAITPDGVTQPADPSAGDRAAAATEPDEEGRRAARLARNRFTTLADVERAKRLEAAASQRRERWMRAAVATGLATLLAGAGFLLFRTPTADELYARIREIAQAAEGDLRDARPLIDRFLARHGDDPRAEEVRGLDHRLDLDSLEKRARRRPLKDADLDPLERDYRAAMAREPESPLACRAALEGIIAVHTAATTTPDDADAELWLALVRRQIERLGPLAERERLEDAERADAALAQARSLARQAAVTGDQVARAELTARRRDILAGLVDVYGQKPHVAEQVREARRLLEPP